MANFAVLQRLQRYLMAITEFNIERLDYLLMLYGMSKEQLLSYLNEGRKRAFTLEDISGDEIKVSLLKKIDDIFKKGLSFYLDFSPIDTNQEAKVFFRKKKFQFELTIEDKRIVDSFESLKSLLDGYRVLTDTTNVEYPLKNTATIRVSPKAIADKVRDRLLPEELYAQQKDVYMQTGDVKMILYALNNKSLKPIIITEETPQSNDGKLFKKLPVICDFLEIDHISISEWLYSNGVKLSWTHP